MLHVARKVLARRVGLLPSSLGISATVLVCVKCPPSTKNNQGRNDEPAHANGLAKGSSPPQFYLSRGTNSHQGCAKCAGQAMPAAAQEKAPDNAGASLALEDNRGRRGAQGGSRVAEEGRRASAAPRLYSRPGRSCPGLTGWSGQT
jgi:hypothetical protein